MKKFEIEVILENFVRVILFLCQWLIEGILKLKLKSYNLRIIHFLYKRSNFLFEAKYFADVLKTFCNVIVQYRMYIWLSSIRTNQPEA